MLPYVVIVGVDMDGVDIVGVFIVGVAIVGLVANTRSPEPVAVAEPLPPLRMGKMPLVKVGMLVKVVVPTPPVKLVVPEKEFVPVKLLSLSWAAKLFNPAAVTRKEIWSPPMKDLAVVFSWARTAVNESVDLAVILTISILLLESMMVA
jgi:hypothetical protein